ncbi:MAG: sensor domain-containing diguanylate cyclase [Spirochaetes bacterium]|nr:sensor domain-containing diguanylate cyclase [Spirochaetota bacterium]
MPKKAKISAKKNILGKASITEDNILNFPKMKNSENFKKSSEDTIRKLKLVIEINSYITKSLEGEEVQKRILQQVKRLLQCQSSSVLLVDKETNRLRFAYLSKDEEGKQLMDLNLKLGEGIAGTVWSNGNPMIINDAKNDPRFTDKVDKKSNTQTSSLIAVPLTYKGEIIGVIEAINKSDGDFDSFDQEMLQYISTQSAIAIKNAELYDMANRDGMTKLFSNKYFRERLREEWSRSNRYKHPLSIVIFDIDNFRTFNNTYGHQAGDRVIMELSKIILLNSRSIDIPCRYGGEEFTIILPETTKKEALIVVERIRQKVEQVNIEYNNSFLNFTVSGGLAAIPDLAPKNVEEFIEMADKALYYSKKNGRNQVTCFNTDIIQ